MSANTGQTLEDGARRVVELLEVCLDLLCIPVLVHLGYLVGEVGDGEIKHSTISPVKKK